MRKIILKVISFLIVLLMVCITRTSITLKADTLSTSEGFHEKVNTSLYLEKAQDFRKGSIYYYLNNVTYYDNTTITTSGKTLDAFIKDDNLYALNDNNMLYKIDITTNEKTSLSLGYDAFDMMLVNDLIYVVGTKDNDAILYIYNLNLTSLSKYIYGGEGYEAFKYIYLAGDIIYLFGEKSGISHNSPFQNVGNLEDTKAFVVTLDSEFHLNKGFYINEHTNKESFTSIICHDDEFYFIIKDAKNVFYQYHLNKELLLVEHYNLGSIFTFDDIVLVDNYLINEAKVYVYIFNHKLYYSIYDGNIIHDYLIKIDVEKLIDAQINNGHLQIYYQSNQNIYLSDLSMYYFKVKNEKVVTYKDPTYLDTDHFVAMSYFEKLDFVYDEALNSDISLNNSAKYLATYTATANDGNTYSLKVPYIVKPYLNVIDQGIYEKGYVLEFTDELYLNEEKLYKGEVLDKVGQFKLKHVTKEGIKEYTIYIKDKYYKDLTFNHYDVLLTQNIKDCYQYNITLNVDKKVKKIYVNDESFAFLQDGKNILLEFSSNYYGITSYRINYLEFDDGTIYELNKDITIKTKKDPPSLALNYQDHNIIYQVNDDDEAILDVIVKYYENDKLLHIEKTYLEDYQINYVSKANRVEVLLQYELATSNIYESMLFSTNIDKLKKDNKLFSLTFTWQDNTLENITINSFNQKAITFTNATVFDTSLDKTFIKETNNLYIYLIIIFTIIMVISSIIIFILKKKKAKKA